MPNILHLESNKMKNVLLRVMYLSIYVVVHYSCSLAEFVKLVVYRGGVVDTI